MTAPSPSDIMDAVVAVANVSWHELLSRNRWGRLSRYHELTDARAASAILMRETLGTSWGLIAKRLGYGCHSSALVAARRAAVKPSVVRIVDEARKELARHTGGEEAA